MHGSPLPEIFAVELYRKVVGKRKIPKEMGKL